jgi:hypothetical protein
VAHRHASAGGAGGRGGPRAAERSTVAAAAQASVGEPDELVMAPDQTESRAHLGGANLTERTDSRVDGRDDGGSIAPPPLKPACTSTGVGAVEDPSHGR